MAWLYSSAMVLAAVSAAAALLGHPDRGCLVRNFIFVKFMLAAGAYSWRHTHVKRAPTHW